MKANAKPALNGFGLQGSGFETVSSTPKAEMGAVSDLAESKPRQTRSRSGPSGQLLGESRHSLCALGRTRAALRRGASRAALESIDGGSESRTAIQDHVSHMSVITTGHE
jgi:hypothetical protein